MFTIDVDGYVRLSHQYLNGMQGFLFQYDGSVRSECFNSGLIVMTDGE
jgi:hypothetical protein